MYIYACNDNEKKIMNFKESKEGGICEDWERRKGRGNGVIISQSQKIKENVKKKLV